MPSQCLPIWHKIVGLEMEKHGAQVIEEVWSSEKAVIQRGMIGTATVINNTYWRFVREQQCLVL